MKQMSGASTDYQELFQRASLAATPQACEECLAEIGRALESVTAPADRARVRSNQWRTADVCADAMAALRLFEIAGEFQQAIDAASLGAAHASRLGELSLASELATRSILDLDSVTDDRLRVEIANRLGIFCYSFLDYDRAVQQFEVSLEAAERMADADKIYRQLHNIADALLLAFRQGQLSGRAGTAQLDRAELTVRRLLAEVLCELGRPDEAAGVIDEFRPRTGAITPAAQRAALAWVEARCLRLTGRAAQAVTQASRAVTIAEASGDDHELMLAIEERAACEEAAGDLQGALRSARKVKALMWAIHQRQTKQLVEETWARVGLERDRRDLQARAAEATRSAETDALTGIGNRRLLERFLAADAVRDAGVAVIVIDIDHFKTINDTLGHDAGDVVLRRLGQLLRSKTRAGQAAVRYGGDEFVLALPDVKLGAACGFADRLRLAVLGHDWASVAPGLHVTASFGVACGPAASWQAVIAAADTPLYLAKQRGGNAVGTAPPAARPAAATGRPA